MKKTPMPPNLFQVFVVFILGTFPVAQGVRAVITQHHSQSSRYGHYILEGEKAVIQGFGMISVGLGFIIPIIGMRIHPQAQKFWGIMFFGLLFAGLFLVRISSPLQSP